MKKEKSNLTVWKNDWCKSTALKSNIRLFFRKIKWSYQRITRGFSDYDAYDLDTYYAELISQSLHHLAEVTHSYPGREPYETPEKWENKLKEISELFGKYNQEDNNKYEDAVTFLSDKEVYTVLGEDYKNKMWQCYKTEDERLYNEKHNSVLTGLNELGKIWESLWD